MPATPLSVAPQRVTDFRRGVTAVKRDTRPLEAAAAAGTPLTTNDIGVFQDRVRELGANVGQLQAAADLLLQPLPAPQPPFEPNLVADFRTQVADIKADFDRLAPLAAAD